MAISAMPTANTSSSTLVQRKPASTRDAEDETSTPAPLSMSTELLSSQKLASPSSNKPPSLAKPRSLKGFFNSTTLILLIATILGLIVLINVAFTARVLLKIVQKSKAARRDRSTRPGSVEISIGDRGVRLEEIAILDGNNKIQVYKGKKLSKLPDITSTNGSFLIVEPRQHSLLSFVCTEFHKVVPPDWVLYIVHSYANAEYARKSVENIPRKKVFMQLNTKSLEVDDYNSIFKDSRFWEFVKTEHILIFQTDSVPCGPKLDMKSTNLGQFGYIGCAYYDQVGPNTGYWDEGWSFYGSGGLSLRRKSFTLECLQWYKLNNRGMHEYEDVTFSHCVDVLYRKLRYPKPTLDDVGDFCTQNTWGNLSREPRAFGAHQIGIQMQDRKVKREFLEYCPMAALI
jgi:hypothetical protein